MFSVIKIHGAYKEGGLFDGNRVPRPMGSCRSRGCSVLQSIAELGDLSRICCYHRGTQADRTAGVMASITDKNSLSFLLLRKIFIRIHFRIICKNNRLSLRTRTQKYTVLKQCEKIIFILYEPISFADIGGSKFKRPTSSSGLRQADYQYKKSHVRISF